MKYFGKFLHIDLSNKNIKIENFNKEDIEKYLGGYGLGIKYFIDYLSTNKKFDPYSPKNPLIICAGALCGTLVPGASKTTLLTKYPTISDENDKHWVDGSVGGGAFGEALRNAGFEVVFIVGSSKDSVYIEIIDQEVKICDASEYWNKKDVVETTIDLKKKYGDESSVITIGPAGENLVRQAMTFIDDTNSLGRSGIGAILGSKKLKAVVVKGTGGIKIYDKKRFFKRLEKIRNIIMSWQGRDHWLKLGMGAGWHMFRYTQYPGKWSRKKWDDLYGEPKRLETAERTIACPSCLIACRCRWKIKDGEFKGNSGQGSPYGKSATSGQLLNIEDHQKTLQLVIMANKAGIDFYTTTRMIDFVTQSFVDGKISTKETMGLELERSFDCYVDLFNKIVNREGFGDVLAEGWINLKRKTGLDPQDYWYSGYCKGVDFIYDARAANLHPLIMSFYTNTRPHHGGNHTLTVGPGHSMEELKDEVSTWGLPKEVEEGIFEYSEYSGKLNVGRYVKYMEDGMAMRNSLGCCSIYAFYGFIFPDDIADFYSAATGYEVRNYDILKVGERIWNLKKLMNVMVGFDRSDDKIPELWKRPMKGIEGDLVTMDYFKEKELSDEDFNKCLDDYYKERGWDLKNGIPSEKKLKELKLDDYVSIIDQYKKIGKFD